MNNSETIYYDAGDCIIEYTPGDLDEMIKEWEKERLKDRRKREVELLRQELMN